MNDIKHLAVVFEVLFLPTVVIQVYEALFLSVFATDVFSHTEIKLQGKNRL